MLRDVHNYLRSTTTMLRKATLRRWNAGAPYEIKAYLSKVTHKKLCRDSGESSKRARKNASGSVLLVGHRRRRKMLPAVRFV